MRRARAIIVAAGVMLLGGCLDSGPGHSAEEAYRRAPLEAENAVLRTELAALRAENSRLRVQLLGAPRWERTVQTEPAGSLDAVIPYMRICPRNQVIIGFRGRHGSLVDSIMAVCGPLDAIGERGPDGVRSEIELDPVGGYGGVPFERMCPDGSVVVGANGTAGSLIDSIVLMCEPVARGVEPEAADEVEPTGASPHTESSEAASSEGEQPAAPPPDRVSAAPLERIGQQGGESYESRCPVGFVAVGISGRQSSQVGRMAFHCVELVAGQPVQ